MGREEVRGSRGAAPSTSAGAQPGRPRVPLNPVTQQIMAGEAGFLLPPAAAGGRAGRRRGLLRPPAKPRGHSGRSRSGGVSLTIFDSLGVQTALPLTVNRPRRSLPFPGWPPNIRPEVRPSGRRKEGGRGAPGGAAWSRGSHASRVPGTWGQRTVRDVGWRRAGRGARASALFVSNPDRRGRGSINFARCVAPSSTKSLR